jgi:hypothetical protein
MFRPARKITAEIFSTDFKIADANSVSTFWEYGTLPALDVVLDLHCVASKALAFSWFDGVLVHPILDLPARLDNLQFTEVFLPRQLRCP